MFRLAAPLGSADGNTGPFTFVLQGRGAFKGERLERVSRNGDTVRLEGSGKLGGQPGYRFSIEARERPARRRTCNGPADGAHRVR